MADLLLRLLAEGPFIGRRERCGNCGAPWEAACSYCGRGETVPALLDGSYVLSRRDVERLSAPPLPEPSDGKPRRE